MNERERHSWWEQRLRMYPFGSTEYRLALVILNYLANPETKNSFLAHIELARQWVRKKEIVEGPTKDYDRHVCDKRCGHAVKIPRNNLASYFSFLRQLIP